MSTESELTDIIDLMRDEFMRIRAISNNSEIDGLCDRAISNIHQHVPVIVQRDEFENKYIQEKVRREDLEDAIKKLNKRLLGVDMDNLIRTLQTA